MLLIKLIVIVVLTAFCKKTENATIATIAYSGVMVLLAAVEGRSGAGLVGLALGTLIFGGIYFGFIRTLRDSGWVWWVFAACGLAFLLWAY